ncbi:hypothetical protein BJ508DRAFT_332736 [Ascobolus immersus RN42]|uniref:Uncharacterized protein n=1 Tax=Ascobolus immersus RN42 TaxID=1160509 RepID=A0A3N4HNF0_ASCIM|nr:hypothetical protein BJ508DRAFT_332736 [Ascobolus immersus RN42]
MNSRYSSSSQNSTVTDSSASSLTSTDPNIDGMYRFLEGADPNMITWIWAGEDPAQPPTLIENVQAPVEQSASRSTELAEHLSIPGVIPGTRWPIDGGYAKKAQGPVDSAQPENNGEGVGQRRPFVAPTTRGGRRQGSNSGLFTYDDYLRTAEYQRQEDEKKRMALANNYSTLMYHYSANMYSANMVNIRTPYWV